MMEQVPVATILGLPIYAFSIFLCMSIIFGLGVTMLCQKHRDLPRDMALQYSLWAIPMGVIGARFFYCFARWDFVFYEQGWTFLFKLWNGGFALYGALFGCILAAWIYSRLAGLNAGDVLDCISPGAALVIAGERFSESLTTQGIGGLVEVETLQRFPFAVLNKYDEWVLPVFLLEGIAALTIGATVYRYLRRKNEKPGDIALLFLLLFGASQVILESLRADDFLRWGFVRVSQVMSMVLVMIVAIQFSIRIRGRKKCTPLLVAGFSVLVAGIIACIAIEFALDKSSIPNLYLHIIMTIILCLMTGVVLSFWKAGKQSSGRIAQGV